MARSGKINVDNLLDTIVEELADYEYLAKSTLEKAINKAAEAGEEQLHSTSPKDTGEYARSWTTGDKRGSKGRYSKVIYADSPHYRLTHLLEKGHAKVNGGRVAARPHIKMAETFTIEKLIDFIKEGLE